jgi:16S rRNA (guanine1207-N2)-methyltransferase
MLEDIYQIKVNIKGIDLIFRTAPGLFSPCHVDEGTSAMLSLVDFHQNDKVLDLGCGYGTVGILSAKIIDPTHVFMIDSDPVAIEYARQNAELNGTPNVNVLVSNGFSDLQETHFTKILCNPPYHADFSVPKRLIIGGQLFMVTKYLDWYEKKLKSIFGSVKTCQINDYNVFIATKKSFTWASSQKKKK